MTWSFRKPQLVSSKSAGPVMLHSVSDPALANLSAEARDRYIETFDASHLVPTPGMELAAFEVHTLGVDRFNALESMCARERRDAVWLYQIGGAFFSACVRAIHGMKLVQDDGTEAIGTISGDNLRYTPHEVMVEIGGYAYRLCKEANENFFVVPRDYSSAGTDT